MTEPSVTEPSVTEPTAEPTAPTAAETERRSVWRDDRNYQIVLGAEVRRLARELQMTGPMPREVLARRCHASSWREGSFEAALLAGVRQGTLKQLPFDFVDVPRPAPAPR